MSYNQEIGKFGETLAKKYLVRCGYKILDVNVKKSYQEIDIIAYIKGIYVFVEVKTRTSTTYGNAYDAINAKKIISLKKGIMNYAFEHNISYEKIRLDLISIDLIRENNIAKIRHYKEII